MNDITLPGCTPEPLMAYLEALDILRLDSEQKDRNARGWWKNDVFRLRLPALFKEATTEVNSGDTILNSSAEEFSMVSPELTRNCRN